MPESKAVIGLTWEPKLPLLSSASKSGSEKSQNVAESSCGLWKPDSELIEGLFVPHNNPRIVNKLLRKQVKDTTGTKWYAHSFSFCSSGCSTYELGFRVFW